MKKEKITLGNLKVKSFVTSYDKSESDTVKGGILSIGRGCSWTCQGTRHTDALFCRNPYEL